MIGAGRLLVASPLDREGRVESGNNLAALDLVRLDASQQEANVLTRDTTLERPVELLDTGGDRLQHAAQPEDLDPAARHDDTLLDPTRGHRPAAFDGMDAL